ncbi:MAG: prepilin peptidase [Ramlibacter sp.]|jgi:preprotein translocase subunit SecA|uniref:preprotein translocase subunit SecA n=1 Tax=Ramlibacter sp. TaxID=1917967 RepID=UPI00263031EB|nr:DEAD/DEAH box helicase [Ramlibacter sp.]MDB5751728.1 prepilin peptidase [Ramlibacter sp.]
MSARWPFPGVVWGDYPERLPQHKRAPPLRRAALERFADSAAAAPGLSEADLPAHLQALRRGTPDSDGWLLDATVLAASALRHTLGYAPHRQQLLAARVLLDDCLAEMATGEGKTAAIAIAAGVAALARTPVHVVTSNDYLGERDAHALRPFYARLGLRVACVTQPMQAAERRQAYAADVAYCTAKELAFDYLRDGMRRAADLSPLEQRARRLGLAAAIQAPVLRGLSMAILDEADTVLIDEARVPLVLAQGEGSAAEAAFYGAALAVAQRLARGADYLARGDGRRFELTPQGRQQLAAWPAADHPLLGHRAHREAAVESALVALHVLRRDHDYVVREGQVTLVDETTGRAAAGRAWSAGLHQLVERKEGVAASQRNATITQITLQRFFPRYLRLAGASGTLAEAVGELRSVYQLKVVVVPRRTPSLVRHLPPRLLADSQALWQAVAQDAKALAQAGRAVLIGTETVAQSEALSRQLASRQLSHQVLNARQDQEESQLIAAAGQCGRITVATSMAGRGTDIVCEPAVLANGGLHVVLCQVNASARIDRQFLGRAGRQGQPGSVQTVAAVDFPVLRRWWPAWWLHAIGGRKTWPMLPKFTVSFAQWRESFTYRYQRARLNRQADSEERDLTFSRQVKP